MIEIPELTPHPLKAEVKKAHLTLWQIRKMINGPSESVICRMLNGTHPMSQEVENGLKHILAEIKQPIAATK